MSPEMREINACHLTVENRDTKWRGAPGGPALPCPALPGDN